MNAKEANWWNALYLVNTFIDTQNSKFSRWNSTTFNNLNCFQGLSRL